MSSIKKEVTVSVTVKAPLDKVWKSYTEPANICRWNFASDDWCCPSASNDLRAGGTYKARMEAKDGSAGFDFEGVYDKVVAGEVLSFALGDERHVTTLFEAQDGGAATKVSTTFDLESENSEEMQRDGWQAILNNFQRFVELAE